MTMQIRMTRNTQNAGGGLLVAGQTYTLPRQLASELVNANAAVKLETSIPGDLGPPVYASSVSGARKQVFTIPDALVASNWVLSGTNNGNVSNPADDPVRGPVLNINVTNVATKVTFARDLSLTFDEFGGLSFWLNRDANLSVLDVSLYFAKYDKTIAIGWNKGMSGFDAGRWIKFAAPASEFESKTAGMVGSIADNLTGVGFAATAAAGQTTTLKIAGLMGHEVSAGTVTMLFDDARLDTYTEAFRIMSQYGFVGSVAAEYHNLGRIGAPYNIMTQANVNEMYAAGWDVLGHHVTQMPTLNEAQQVAIYRAQKEWMQVNGFARGDHIWVWPGGARDAASETYAGRYYQVMRRTGSPTYAGIPGIFDPTIPAIRYVTSGLDAAALLSVVDEVKEFGGNVTFVLHALVNNKVASEDYLISDFEAVCAGIAARGMKVIPSSQVWTKT
jgi:hypothetical protein